MARARGRGRHWVFRHALGGAWAPDKPLPSSGMSPWVWWRDQWLETAGSLDQWTDLTGNGFHALRDGAWPSPAGVPVDGNLNGQPSCDWTGLAASAHWNLGGGAGPGTGDFSWVFVVWDAVQVTGTQLWGNGGPNDCAAYARSGGWGDVAYRQNFVDYFSFVPAIGGGQCVVQSWSAGAAYIRRNAVNLLVGSPWASIVPAWAVLTVGNNWAWSAAFSGHWAECIGFPGALDAADCAAVETYARDRYALPF